MREQPFKSTISSAAWYTTLALSISFIFGCSNSKNSTPTSKTPDPAVATKSEDSLHIKAQVDQIINEVFGSREEILTRLTAAYDACNEEQKSILDQKQNLILGPDSFGDCFISSRHIKLISNMSDTYSASTYLSQLLESPHVSDALKADLYALLILDTDLSNDHCLSNFAHILNKDTTRAQDPRLAVLNELYLNRIGYAERDHISSFIFILTLYSLDNPIDYCRSIIGNSTYPEYIRARALWSCLAWPETYQELNQLALDIYEGTDGALLKKAAFDTFTYTADSSCEERLLKLIANPNYQEVAIRGLLLIDSKRGAATVCNQEFLEKLDLPSRKYAALLMCKCGDTTTVNIGIQTFYDNLAKYNDLSESLDRYNELGAILLERSSYDPTDWYNLATIQKLIEVRKKRSAKRLEFNLLSATVALSENTTHITQPDLIEFSQINKDSRLEFISSLNSIDLFIRPPAVSCLEVLGSLRSEAEISSAKQALNGTQDNIKSYLEHLLKSHNLSSEATVVEPKAEKNDNTDDIQQLLELDNHKLAFALLLNRMNSNCNYNQAVADFLITHKQLVEQKVTSPFVHDRLAVSRLYRNYDFSREHRRQLAKDNLNNALLILNNNDSNSFHEDVTTLLQIFDHLVTSIELNPIPLLDKITEIGPKGDRELKHFFASYVGNSVLNDYFKNEILKPEYRDEILSSPSRKEMLDMFANMPATVENKLRFGKSTNKLLSSLPETVNANNKNAVFLISIADHNGVFSGVELQVRTLVDKGYQVYVFDYNGEKQFFEICDRLSKAGHEWVDIVALCQHASPEGGQLAWPAKNINFDEYFLNHEDAIDMGGRFEFLKKGSMAFLNGCSAAGITKDDQPNFAESMFSGIPNLGSLHAPQTPTGMVVNGFEFDDNDMIKGIIYKSPTTKYSR